MQILLFKLPKPFILLNFQQSVGRVPWHTKSILIIKMSPFHFGRRKTDVLRTLCALSRKALKCPVLRHLDYRLGRGIRKIPNYACISGTLLIASRTLPTIPVFLFLCPNSTLFPKWGKIRQITSLIRSKIVVKIGVSYYSP